MLEINAVFDSNSAWCQEKDNEDSLEHAELRERLGKTLYYGRMPSLERPSLALTELAVDVLQQVAPRELGKVDMYWASEVSRDTTLSPCPLTVGLMYANRLKKKNSSFARQISSSDLFLVSMMMASKFLHDEGEEDCVLNDEWATSAHMDVAELNELERNFIAALDWDLFVNSADFWTSLNNIEQLIAYRKSRERGNFTYTDLSVLVDNSMSISLCHMLLELFKVAALCVAVYASSVMVLAATAPVLYTAATTISTRVPVHHLVVLDSQSALSYVVPTTHAGDGVDNVTESFDRGPAAAQPQSFLISLFHLLTFIDIPRSSGSFPAIHEPNKPESTCSRNCSLCFHSPGKSHSPSCCSDKNSATGKEMFHFHPSTTKRTNNGSCRRRLSSHHEIFPHRASNVVNLSSASEASIPPGMLSPMLEAHNASLLFNVGTLLEMV